MKKLGPNIWVADQDLKLVGCNFGTRMTVVRFGPNQLLLYSPIKMTEELKAEVDKAGNVAAIVAPNPMHHLFLKPWVEAYPEAKFYCVPELLRKRSDLPDPQLLTELETSPWEPDIALAMIKGRARFTEAWMLHRPSKTLILADMAFNMQKASGLWENIFLRLYGTYGKFGPTKMIRAILKGVPEVSSVLRTVSLWDFDKVVPCHGEILMADAHETFERAFADLAK